MKEVITQEPIESHKKFDRSVSFSLRKVSIIVILIALPLLGFWAGTAYQRGKDPKVSHTANSRFSTGGRFAGPGGFQRGNRAIGQVTAVSSTSITVSSRLNNTDKTYVITSSTTVTNDGQAASVSDIKVGDTVFITPDTSNASNAASITLNPSFGGPGANGTSSNDSSSADLPTMSQ